MSIANKIHRILGCKNDIKRAIEFHGVSVDNAPFDQYADRIMQLANYQTNDLNKVYYIDHTGVVHHEYTLDEFLNLTSEPENPQFAGLTPQGWQMSLSSAQAFVRKYGWGPVIGQNYTTDDGTTRVWVDINEDCFLTLTVYYSSLSNATKLKIDWGDGSTMSQSNAVNGYVTHTYSQRGKYCIRYVPQDNISYRPSSNPGSGYPTIFGYCYSSCPLFICPIIKKIEYGGNVSGWLGSLIVNDCDSISIPSGCSIGIYSGVGVKHAFCTNFGTEYALTNLLNFGSSDIENFIIPNEITNPGSFANSRKLKRLIINENATSLPSCNSCYNLLAINIPSGVTQFQSQQFDNCFKLKKVNFPSSLTSIGNYAFRNCYSLNGDLEIPEGVTSIGVSSFHMAIFNVGKITIPSTVTSIGSSAFNVQLNVNTDAVVHKHVYLKPTTPPTAGNTTIFGTLNTKAGKLTIHVPQGCLSTYQNASGWNTYATLMVDDITD